jgi:MFS family permease
LADRIGRRAVFIGTVLYFSLATGILALTPDHGWIFLTIFRFFVGFVLAQRRTFQTGNLQVPGLCGHLR